MSQFVRVKHFQHLAYDQTKDRLELKSVPLRRHAKLLVVVSLKSFQRLAKQFANDKNIMRFSPMFS